MPDSAASPFDDPADARTEPRRASADPHRGLRGIRIRILATFLALLVLSGAASTVAIHEVLVISVGDRVQEALGQEIRELNQLVTGIDPRTGDPFASPESVFDVFFDRNVPSNDEAMLSFVEGRPHRSTLSRYPLSGIPDDVSTRFAAASRATATGGPADGEFDTELGVASYRSLAVQIDGRDGLFVVVVLPVDDREDISTLQWYGAAGVMGVLLVAAAVAWIAVNRTLVPVRQLTTTARRISESDLSGRIEVRGSDEAAEMARSFNAMLDRLERIFRAERDFIRDASHELRVPLTVCLGNLELLLAEDVEDDDLTREQTIALVMDEVERMSRIVQDLRLLVDARHDDFVQPEVIDLAAFAEELAGKARALAPRRWQAPATPPAPGATLVADRYRLTEAVMNLAENAAHHTAEDDVIEIGAEADGDVVRLWVADSGPGVPVAEQARIFERFRRGSLATRRYRGSGLGLAIVRAVTEAHGGAVELRSVPGEGARFTIVLPARPRATDWRPKWQ